MNFEVKISQKPIDYKKSIEILEKRVCDVSDGKKSELLWIIEHKNVYTGGIRSKNSELLNKRIKVVKTNRGGKYTYHGPGQKVVYFVLNLNKRKKDIRNLLNKVEKCITDTLIEYKIESYPDKKNIGIWVRNKKNSMKIASIGIRVKKWIAYHGFAINVNNDLLSFNKIIPCGIKDKNITSLKKLGIQKFNNIDEVIIKNFLNTFL